MMRAREFLSEVEAADLEHWNPERFQVQQTADPIGEISNKQQFSSSVLSSLNMPIKLPGGTVKCPYQNRGVREFVERCVKHNQSVNPRFDQCHLYLTVDQRIVEPGKSQRRGGAHFDGMQGVRHNVKLPMYQNYIVSDYNPTTLYNQPFDARGLSDKHHNWFHELEKQVDKSRVATAKPYEIYFMSGYHMHESPIAAAMKARTFMRLGVSYQIGDKTGETKNPQIHTNWKQVDREIPKELQKRSTDTDSADPSTTFIS